MKKRTRYTPALEAVERRICCSAGGLDTSFNGTGTQLLPIGHYATSVALQNGKAILVGASTQGVTVARLNSDGTPDTGFGSGGSVSYPAAFAGLGTSDDPGPSVAIQSDGKILVTAVLASGAFAVYRLQPNGGLDAGFGSGGASTIDFGSDPSGHLSIGARRNGQIVVATGYNAAQLQPDGTLDTSFGAGGEAALPAGFQATAIAIQSDGQTDLVGGDGGDAALCRLTVGGAIVTTLGTNGVATYTGLPGSATSVALQSNDHILVAGYKPSGSAFAARLNPDGTLDAGFNGGGSLALPSQFATAKAIGTEWDGGILVSGSSSRFTSGSHFVVARLTPAGRLDPNFGQGGIQTVGFGAGSSAYSEAFTANHKLVVSGGTGTKYAAAVLLLDNPNSGGGGGGGVSIGGPGGGGDGPISIGLPLQPGPTPWVFHRLRYASPAPRPRPGSATTPAPAPAPLRVGHVGVRHHARPTHPLRVVHHRPAMA